MEQLVKCKVLRDITIGGGVCGPKRDLNKDDIVELTELEYEFLSQGGKFAYVAKDSDNANEL